MRYEGKNCGTPRHNLSFFILTALAGLSIFLAYVDWSVVWGASAEAEVVEVHDGDTVSLRIEGRTERARLIGIDAPELRQIPWGQKAKKHLRRLLGSSLVRVKTDVEKRDRHGRLLVYLWSSDDRFVNLEMVREGYAMLYTIPPNIAHVDALRKAQTEARTEKRGIWGEKGLEESPGHYRKEHPR